MVFGDSSVGNNKVEFGDAVMGTESQDRFRIDGGIGADDGDYDELASLRHLNAVE